MRQISEDKLADFFSKAFHEVALPVLEDIKQNMATKDDIDRLERKIEKGTERMDRHGKTLEDHEKRIKNLETS